MTWLIALSIVVTLLGVTLLVVGLRGRRIDDHPLCRACGFDLTGAPSTRCPECGRATTNPRVGHRRRRAMPIAIGAFALAFAAAVGMLVATGVARRIDWRSIEPNWYAIREARGTLPGDAGAAIELLLARDRAEALNDASRGRLAALLLALQADARQTWDPRWGSWLLRRAMDGRLTSAEFDAFARDGLAIAIDGSKAAVRPGDSIAIAFDFGCGPRSFVREDPSVPFRLSCDWTFDDAALPTAGLDPDAAPVSTLDRIGPLFSISLTPDRQLAAGHHSITVRTHARLYGVNGDQAIGDCWSTLTVPFEMLAADTPRRITDPAIVARARAAVNVEVIRVDGPQSTLFTTSTGMPADGVYDVEIVQGQRHATAGPLIFDARYPLAGPMSIFDAGALEPGVADVFLRPNDDAAFKVPSVAQIVDGELRFSNVRVLGPHEAMNP